MKKISENMSKNSIVLQKCSVVGDSTTSKAVGSINEIPSGVGSNGGSKERDEIPSGVSSNGGSIERDEIPSGVGSNGDTGDTEEPAHSSVSGKETWNVVILAVSFLCLFSSYMSINNLQGSLNDEGGLGVFSLSCLFASSIVSCILSPMIITVLGAKSVLMVAFITHLIYTAANFYPRFATLFPSTLLVGALAGPFWASQVINETMYCGTNDCPRDETEDLIADPDHTTVYILFSIFLGLEIIGLCILAICLSPIPRHAVMSKASIKESLLSWFIVLIKTDMKYLVPLQCYFAFAEEICFTEFTKSFVSCPIGIQNVGYVMAAFGGGSSVTSLLFSRLAQYTKRYVIFTTAAILQMTLIVCMYNWIPAQNDHLYIYLVATFWGVCEGLWKTQNSAMLGEHFPNNVRAVFSVKECFKSITFTITFIYSSLICVYVKLLIAMIFLATSMTLYYFVENRFMQNQKRQTRWRTTTITNRDI
ncbi:protein unc-93 homolog A-like [Haliotis cracherodii]|uniref:protein unc-93 homolog A-like n=1 Tax=Haliotis cracherodii TaxID=6455 RepID=UPI0039EA682B